MEVGEGVEAVEVDEGGARAADAAAAALARVHRHAETRLRHSSLSRSFFVRPLQEVARDSYEKEKTGVG